MSNQQLFNEEPEIAVLSIVLKNPQLVFELLSLRSFMLSSWANKVLYETIEGLVQQNLVPEQHLLENFLKSKGMLENVGGVEYIEYLKGFDFDIQNLKEYEKLIVDSYKARSLINLCSSTPTKIKTVDGIDKIISSLRRSLEELTTMSGGELTTLLKDSIKDSWDALVERVKNPGIRGATSGFTNVDVITTGINEGELWIISGRPGSGKTSVMLSMMKKQAEAGVPVLMFSLEMSKQLLVERMISMDTGIPLTPNIRMGTITQKELDSISESMSKFKDYPLYLDTSFIADVDYVEATIRKFKRTSNIEVAYIDYAQLLVKRDLNSTHALGELSRRLKLLALELKMGIVLGSQLNRGVESREDKRPTMSDLRQSGNLEEDTDLVVGLYRDEYYNPNSKFKGILEWIINKHRNGPVGTVLLEFDSQTTEVKDR